MTAPRDCEAEVGSVRLHYVDWGGDGRPAILHHPTGFHARIWDPIARELAKRFRVYALDARGHGDSDKPETGYDWPVFIGDLIGLLDGLGIRGALGVGHSVGATVTAGAAAERPDLFSRIVLIDPVLFPREFRSKDGPERPMAEAARRRREVWTSRQAMIESYGSRPPFDRWSEEALRLYVEHGTTLEADGRARLKCPPQIEAQVFSMSRKFDGWGTLERLRLPTLLVRGGKSTSFSGLDAKKAAAAVPGGRLVTVPDTTHFIPMEDPGAIVRAIEDFAAPPPLPIPTRGLAHLALRVSDLETMSDFYQRIFGMRVVWRPDADNVYLSSGRDNLALHRVDSPEPHRGPLDHLGFLVDSADAVFEAARALAARGIPLAKPPRHHRDGSCSLYVEDPEGNVVQVIHLPDTNGA